MIDATLEEAIEDAVNEMEAKGVDFTEEVGFFEIDLTSRPDLFITVYVVDKKTSEAFEGTLGGIH